MFLDKGTLIPLLHRLLDVAAVRHRVTASNIANITTPGYRHLTVSFDDHVKRAISSPRRNNESHPSHISLGVRKQPSEVTRIVPSGRPASPEAFNNVDINDEMASLAKNQLYYQFAARMIARQFNGLKTSISGRVR